MNPQEQASTKDIETLLQPILNTGVSVPYALSIKDKGIAKTPGGVLLAYVIFKKMEKENSHLVNIPNREVMQILKFDLDQIKAAKADLIECGFIACAKRTDWQGLSEFVINPNLLEFV